jgi:hypothetical protein
MDLLKTTSHRLHQLSAIRYNDNNNFAISESHEEVNANGNPRVYDRG